MITIITITKEKVVVALVRRATAANRDLCHVLWPLYVVLLCA